MVRKREEFVPETRPQMRGGNGSVVLCPLEGALLGDNTRLFARLSLAPGCSIGAHTHTGETEFFYFIQGEGVVTDDGARVPVRAGDSMTTPSGHSHSVENTGDTELSLVAVIVRD